MKRAVYSNFSCLFFSVSGKENKRGKNLIARRGQVRKYSPFYNNDVFNVLSAGERYFRTYKLCDIEIECIKGGGINIIIVIFDNKSFKRRV